jgi:hypothetical protein
MELQIMGRFQFEVARDAYASHYPPPETFNEALRNVASLWPNIPKGKRETFCQRLINE